MSVEGEIVAPLHPVAAIEYCYAQGWTDGLPVVPPTEERVAEMVAASGRLADEMVGIIPPRGGVATVEKIAINAVMAGCLPAYLPILLAGLEAMLDPAFNLHGVAASTKGSAPLLIVSGPLADALGFNSRDGVFGPGWRANATVGRAVRLILRNIGGALPGELDRGTLGHPGRYSYCIAENDADSPWEPLRVEQGYATEDTVVVAFGADAPHQILEHSRGAEQLLETMADSMAALGNYGLVTRPGEFVVVLCPEHAAIVAADGWSRADVKRFLHERARRPLHLLKARGHVEGAIAAGDESRLEPITTSPDDILLLVAGGAGRFSAHIPRWAGSGVHHSVIKPVGACAECAI